jgi:hypothetical protein
MANEYYLKKLKDINTYGYSFDEYSYSLTKYFYKFDFGLPERDFQSVDRIGNGVSVQGGQKYGKRLMTLTGQIENGLSNTRLLFLKNWISTQDDIYLIRVYQNIIQKIQVKPVLSSGDKYSTKVNLASDDFTLKLLAEKPLFENVDSTTISFYKNTNPFYLTLVNSGVLCAVNVNFVFDSPSGTFRISLYENLGCKITKAFLTNTELNIDSSDLAFKINGAIRNDLTFSGTPFFLETGSNILKINTISAGEGVITYNERFL